MTIEKMTVHRALAELKVIDSRIMDAIEAGTFCYTNKHSNKEIYGVAVKDFKKIMQGDYDKCRDLINRANAIKRAVTASNATTKVSVGDVEYTVAEAIFMKNHGMEKYEELLEEMKKQYSEAKATLLKENGQELEKKAENYVIGIFGNKESKTSSDELEKIRKEFIVNHTIDFIDPISIKDEIEKLEAMVNTFKDDIDAALSVSNATTGIEITY